MVMLHCKELQTQVLPLHLRVMLMLSLLSVVLPASPVLLPGHCGISFCGTRIEQSSDLWCLRRWVEQLLVLPEQGNEGSYFCLLVGGGTLQQRERCSELRHFAEGHITSMREKACNEISKSH